MIEWKWNFIIKTTLHEISIKDVMIKVSGSDIFRPLVLIQNADGLQSGQQANSILEDVP